MDRWKIIIYGLLLFLNWIPRVMGILFAVFVSFFALDVFGQGTGFWKTLLSLLVHLIPTFLIIVILIFSWKRPWIGGFCFTLLGIVYLIWSSQTGRGSETIYIPVFLVAAFFLTSWLLRKEIKKAQGAYWEENQ